MRNVIPDMLWIGNARDARDISGVCSLGLAAVVDLAIEEPPIAFLRDIIYCRIPLLDGEGNSPAVLRLAIATVAGLIEAKLPTLVACSGGMSRSPAIAAAALAENDVGTAEAALQKIANSGPCDIAPMLWRDIRSANCSVRPVK